MSFHHAVKVRYSEVDAQGVVFNAHWLTYFDVALTELLTHLGHDPKQVHSTGEGFDVMLVHAELDWRAAAGLGDIVDIEVTVPRLGKSSFDLRYTASVQGNETVLGTMTYVSVMPGQHRARPLPDEVREQLRSYAPAG